ncbi:MAG: DUF4173 domain-containing protein [Candidatus Omnitrophica bacterium]|nr:DUF4173 domain-containing protein [Candidatus Omnitrophota bacterium]MDD5738107.1 DUF4173 domain-containing protein [Candidatus Omnitrophota bacterium]
MIIVLSLALGLLFDVMFYKKAPGISFPIYTAAVIACMLFASAKGKDAPGRRPEFLALPFLFSLMVFVRTSAFLTFMNIFTTIYLLMLYVEMSKGYRIRDYMIGRYVAGVFVPLGYFSQSAAPFKEVESKMFARVLKGLLISIPVLALFTLLFSSADMVFQKRVDYILSKISVDFPARAIIIFIITMLFCGVLAIVHGERRKVEKDEAKRHNLGDVEILVLLGALNALFVFFIVLQFTYLFGGAKNLAAFGITYSEYARKGFFELLTVAVISLMIIWYCEKHITRAGKGHGIFFKCLGALLAVQVILIMVSAFKRLALYEDAFGFTTQRFYSHSFVIFLAVVFILLLIKILTDGEDSVFAFRGFVAFIIYLAVLNAMNPDAFIARKNIDRFANTGKLDTIYLGRLSDDAVPEITVRARSMSVMTRSEILKSLKIRMWAPEYMDWQSFNLARMKARNILLPDVCR